MNFVRTVGVNIFHKVRHFEKMLISPGSLMTRKYCQTQFSKSTSSFVNLDGSMILNANNCSKYRTLTKLPVWSTVCTNPTRAASTHGDHVRLWIIERLVSVSFISLIPAALLFESAITDTILSAAIVMHTHWGLEAIVLDYARPIVVGTLVPKVAFFMLNLLSAATLAGLLVLIYNGPGLTKIIKYGWTINTDRRKAN